MASEHPLLSRRGFLGLTAAAGATGLLSGCSSLAAGAVGSKPPATTTTFWNLWAGGDGARAEQMYEVYKQKYGATSLEAITFAWGNPYYTKLSLATLGGRPPDIAVAHVTRLPSLQRAGLVEKIDDATLAVGGLTAGDFSPPAWEAALVDGEAYCLPFDIGPLVLYYNTDICEKAGLLDDQGILKPLQGVDEFTAALRAGQDAGAEYGAVWPVINDPASNWRWFNTLYTQKGGEAFLSDAGATISMDEDIAASTLEFLARMTASGLVPTTIDYAGTLSAFGSGKAAFMVMGCWEVVTMIDVGVPFSMATLPQLFEQPAAWADSHVLVLPTGERSATDLEQTMRFARSMLEQQLVWAEGGAIPSYEEVLTSQEYQAMKPQSNYADTAEIAVYDPTAWYGGAGSIFMTITGAEIDLVQQGLSSVPDAVKSMRSQLDTYADTPTPL